MIEVDGAAAGPSRGSGSTSARGLHRERSRDRAAFRGRGVGDEAARELQRHLIRDVGFHRLQMEVYGFNERALRHAERAGWVREGVRRKAYWRNDTWVDGIHFGIVEEDL